MNQWSYVIASWVAVAAVLIAYAVSVVRRARKLGK